MKGQADVPWVLTDGGGDVSFPRGQAQEPLCAACRAGTRDAGMWFLLLQGTPA